MPVRPIFDPDHVYFVTATARLHLPLFLGGEEKRLLLDSLTFLRESGRMQLFAFVLMPNHFHMLSKFDADHPLPSVVRDLKRNVARRILERLHLRRERRLLDLLKLANPNSRQTYKVWEAGYDARNVFSATFLQQKLDYIHNNPCQPHWQLADTPEAYPWSSARFYLLEQPALIDLDDVRELL